MLIFNILGGVFIGVWLVFTFVLMVWFVDSRITRRKYQQEYLRDHARRLIDSTVTPTTELNLYRVRCKETDRWRLVAFVNTREYMLLDKDYGWVRGDAAVPARYWSTWYKIRLNHLLPETRAKVIELLLSME